MPFEIQAEADVTSIEQRSLRATAPVSIADAWQERLIKVRGKRAPVVANAMIALQHAPEWEGVLHFDKSSYNTVAKKRPPWEDSRSVPFPWADEDDTRTAAWLQHHGIMAGKETAGQAVQTIAREHSFHPVLDYLESLPWDRTERIDTWLTTYLGATMTEYTRAIGGKWLIGGVARVYRPGCKNDCALILEGLQGTLKSTALRAIAEPWFTDDFPEMGTKDSSLQTRGVWLIELSELDSMSKAENSKVKAFMSRPVDRFRPPYGRRPIEAPRECFFAGTTNHGNYLQDETGARRFWPVRTGTILIDGLRRDRDQLLAEAVAKYKAGAAWWLADATTNAAAADEQRDRYVGDAWDQIIAEWVAGRESVSVREVLAMAIDKAKEHWTQADMNRVSRSLRSMNWERIRVRDGKNLEWRYRKPTE